MNIINILTLRSLKSNKKRTIVTIVGIILASCLLFTVGLGVSTVRQTNIDEAIRQSGEQHVIFSDIAYSNIDKLENDDNISEIIIEQKKDVISDYENINSNYELSIVSVNVSYNDYINLSNGNMPKEKNEIIISLTFARSENYKVGDFINNYKIVGIYDESELHSYKYYNGLQIWDNYAYAYSDIDTSSNVNFYVTYKSFDNIYNNIFSTAESLGFKYIIGFGGLRFYNNTSINYGLLQAYGQYENSGTQAVMFLSLMLLSTILGIFCVFVIYNAFAISLSERRKYMGIIRSVGVTKKQLFKSVFFEAFIVSLIGIPIGFLLGLLLTNSVLLIINKMLEGILLESLKFSIYPFFIFVSFIFVLVTIFISALFPATRASEITPIESIRMNKDIKLKAIKENKFIRKVFGVEGEIAYKNIKRNKRKYKVTLISLCISIILFITFSTYMNYFLEDIGDVLKTDYDIIVGVPNVDNRDEIINEILNSQYVDSSVQYKYMHIYYRSSDKEMFTDDYYNKISNKTFDPILIYGIDSINYNKYKNEVGLTDDSKLILYNSANYYDELTKNNIPYKAFKSDNLELELCNVDVEFANNITTYTEKECFKALNNIYLTNTPFMKLPFGPIIIVDMDRFSEFKSLYSVIGDYDSITIEINSKKFKQFDTIMNSIINKYSNVEMFYQNNALINHNDYMSMLAMKFLFYSVIAFITIIGVTSVFNTINTNISLREIEFSMLRSIGLSKKGFNKMIRLESIFLGIKTLLYGIPLSLFIIYIILNIFDLSYGENKLVMPFPTKYIIISIIGILLIISLTMWYSTRKINDKNIIDSIKNENL